MKNQLQRRRNFQQFISEMSSKKSSFIKTYVGHYYLHTIYIQKLQNETYF